MELLELDENIVNLFEEISADFKEQGIRQEDLDKISNGELFKLVEKTELIDGKKERGLDLFFITRKGVKEYKNEHKEEFKRNLKIKVIDNKDKLLE